MSYFKLILGFLSELLGITKFLIARKDSRETKANEVGASKQYEENETKINTHFNSGTATDKYFMRKPKSKE